MTSWLRTNRNASIPGVETSELNRSDHILSANVTVQEPRETVSNNNDPRESREGERRGREFGSVGRTDFFPRRWRLRRNKHLARTPSPRSAVGIRKRSFVSDPSPLAAISPTVVAIVCSVGHDPHINSLSVTCVCKIFSPPVGRVCSAPVQKTFGLRVI